MNKDDQNNFKVFYVSDMHNIGMTFSYEFCPYCKATQVEEFTAEKCKSIEGHLPFHPHQIIMCVLHIKQRLVENTIGYMASSKLWKDVIEYSANCLV